MKLVSWNVNGLRAALKHGFAERFRALDADVFCVQETKAERGQAVLDLAGYEEYWNSAEKKGYSGTAVFTRVVPQTVRYDMGVAEHDHEGRIITLEFNEFFLVNVYVPNSRRELERLDYRMRWEDDFRAFAKELDAVKPVVLCGDFNCAHQAIDIKNAKSNERSAGFTIEERNKMTELFGAGLIDFYRQLHPDTHNAYTWWSYMPGVREKNVGWRIDYFLGSARLLPQVVDAPIYADIYGSDHCPVGLVLDAK